MKSLIILPILLLQLQPILATPHRCTNHSKLKALLQDELDFCLSYLQLIEYSTTTEALTQWSTETTEVQSTETLSGTFTTTIFEGTITTILPEVTETVVTKTVTLKDVNINASVYVTNTHSVDAQTTVTVTTTPGPYVPTSGGTHTVRRRDGGPDVREYSTAAVSKVCSWALSAQGKLEKETRTITRTSTIYSTTTSIVTAATTTVGTQERLTETLPATTQTLAPTTTVATATTLPQKTNYGTRTITRHETTTTGTSTSTATATACPIDSYSADGWIIEGRDTNPSGAAVRTQHFSGLTASECRDRCMAPPSPELSCVVYVAGRAASGACSVQYVENSGFCPSLGFKVTFTTYRDVLSCMGPGSCGSFEIHEVYTGPAPE